MVNLFFGMIAFIVFFTGLCWGSFLNVWVYRIPRGKKVSSGRSFCGDCGHSLGILDLFPVFSWLLLGGKCRYCKCKLSIEHPLFELMFGLLFLFTYLSFGSFYEPMINPYLWVLTIFVMSVSIVVAKIDWDTTLIPNKITYPSLVIGLIYGCFATKLPLNGLVPQPTIVSSLIGGAVLFALLFGLSVISKGGLGMGDVKWVTFMGLFLGITHALLAMIIACTLNVLFIGFTMLFFGKKIKELPSVTLTEDTEEFPQTQKIMGISVVNGKPCIVLAPFFAAGTLIVWFFGVPIFNWWLTI